MRYDACGTAHTDTKDLCSLLYKNPGIDLSCFLVEDTEQFNQAVKHTFADLPLLMPYVAQVIDVDTFDSAMQSKWFMPTTYQDLDIAQWVLDQCSGDAELQRCGTELLLYQERDLFNLLRYLKYLVDHLREHKVVWGVGRGSSVASFVLYKIGVHRINSLYYDLDPHEFLK